ncbi:MAG: hypothetical protein ACE5OP_01865 [Candidatus Glassbacteria bacterium]
MTRVRIGINLIASCFILTMTGFPVLFASDYRHVEPGVVFHETILVPGLENKMSLPRTMTVLPPGVVIDSSYFDWQANGSLGKRIWANSDGSVHVTYMKSTDESHDDRGMYYYYANESGQQFIPSGNIATFKNGYGCISAYPATTPDVGATAVISTHDYSTYESFTFVDSMQGLGNFTGFTAEADSQVIWPKITVNSDGSMTMIASVRFGQMANGIFRNVGYVRAAGMVSGFNRLWNFFGKPWHDWNNGDMEWPAVQSGDNGKVGVAVPDFAANIHFYESTNAGISFYETVIRPAGLDTIDLPPLPDTLATVFLPWQNVDIVYIGEEPHIVFTALQAAQDPDLGLILYDYGARILHWSPSTGIDTVVVSEFQGAVPSEEETFLYGGLNHTSIDWPQIGTSPDGKTIYIVYVGFNPDDVDDINGISFGDIYCVYSTDNGESWSAPANISNPEGLYTGTDDRYPSIAPVNHSASMEPGKDVYIVYQSDNTAGSSVWEEEPANWDYLLFTGFNLEFATGMERDEKGPTPHPLALSLNQNFPNPFNPATTVCFDVHGDRGIKKHVILIVYDVRGRQVRRLVDSVLEAGSHRVIWDGSDDRGKKVSSGLYFYALRCGEVSITRRMVLVR